VLRLIEAMLKAGSYGKGRLFPSERGTPQGGVVSPLLSNVLLTPFDQELRRKGYQLTRYADDWVITCKSATEAKAALALAARILEQLGVRLNPQKTRIVHVWHGFDFLGYRILRASKKSKLAISRVRRWQLNGLIVTPTAKSIRRFRDRVRSLTRRCDSRRTAELITELNPTLRGWGEYYKRAHVRTLFHRLDRWIVRRIWSHRFRRWRTTGWKQLPPVTLYDELGLVNLFSLIPSLTPLPRRGAFS
jgi:RNA-directed DNA polymerase